MTELRILGVDPSLTATAVACPDCGPVLIRGDRDHGPERLNILVGGIERHMAELRVGSDAPRVLAVLEGYSYASPQQAHQLGELGGLLRWMLWRGGFVYVTVPPARLKKFATGNGNADKFAMLAAAIRTLGYTGSDHNEADALWLREMGLVARGKETTKARASIVAAIEWPDLVAA